MASVKINTGLPRPEDPASSIPEDRWEDLLIVRRHWVRSQLPFDCRLLRQVAEDALLMAPRRGHNSAEDFLREELELDPDLVSRVVGWLIKEQPTEAVPLAVAILKSHGGDRRSEEARKAREDQGDNIPLKHRSTSAAYLKARLHRDHPELAAALDRGEYRSARAAAIEAGIIKPVPSVRLVDDLAKVAHNLRKHLTPEQRIALAEALLQ